MTLDTTVLEKLAPTLREAALADPEYHENIRTAIREGVLRDYRAFVTCVLGYTMEPFHERWFEAQLRNRRTLLLAPRGHGKSTICNVAYVLFLLAHDPNLRCLIVSKTMRQAENFLAEIKRHMESNLVFRWLFGNWVRQDQWQVAQITVPRTKIAKEPTITAMGVGGSLPSWHFDVIIADDVHDMWNSKTKGLRDLVWSWYHSTVLPTMEPTGRVHLIGTRWDADDLYGRIVANNSDVGEMAYKVIVDKAILDEERKQVLWPEMFSLEMLMEYKKEMGPTLFALQYQNDASMAARHGMLFDADDFVVVDAEHVRRLELGALASGCYWDLSTGEEIVEATRFGLQKSSRMHYTAVVGGFVSRDLRFVVTSWWRGRPGLEEQIARIKQNHRENQWDEIGVEANAYQAVLAKHLMATSAFPIRPIVRGKDKVRMCWATQPYVKTGRVLIRNDLLGLRDLLVGFPHSEEDDSVDAFTGWMDMMAKKVRAMEIGHKLGTGKTGTEGM